MEDQTKPVDDSVNGGNTPGEPQPPVPTRALASVTRQLPALSQPRRLSTETKAQREQIAALVSALGDTSHPLHVEAVRDLVAIGDPAVPALSEALNPRRPWLTSFRAAEALGQIGDGHATGPLIEALRHPNSNVRWGAVAALAAIGDARALLELRRVARNDRGRTTWGESVAGGAQSALDQMQSQNVLLRSAELLKTAVACVLMLVGLVFAWSVITTLRDELGRVGREPVDAVVVAPLVRTAVPTTPPQAVPTPLLQPTALPTPEAPAATTEITGTVLTTGNVRTLPSRESGQRIGIVSVGDEVVFISMSPDQAWYRVRLGSRRSPGSQISSADGSGWVISTVLSPPNQTVVVEQPPLPTATLPSPTP
jgi:hypothetical protein